MKEIAKSGFKAMKLSFYQPTDTPKRVGGEMKTHFTYVSLYTFQKRMRNREYKRACKYRKKHPLLSCLTPFIEASKCHTLDTFTSEEVKTQ
jgi:hypothetical protein